MTVFAYAGRETGGDGQGIARFRWDEETGTLSLLGFVSGIDDAIWLVADQASQRLYACSGQGGPESRVMAYAIDPASGDLRFLNEQPAGGADCCHASLSRDGSVLMVANYNGASLPGVPDAAVRVFPVTAEGLGAATATIRHSGSGPNAARQERDHAHWIGQDPTGGQVRVADLGIDRMVAYRLGSDGGLTPDPAADLAIPAGLGPRHAVLDAAGQRLFVIAELEAAVLSFAATGASGALEQVHMVKIDAPEGVENYPSGIALTSDGGNVFGALRGVDEVIGLAVDPESGALSVTGRWPSGGEWPRDLCLSPGERHLIVANQNGGTIAVHPLVPGAGRPAGAARIVPLQGAMGVVFATF
ncbi:MAG: lactonase family protein [Rubellimicrobium sp.]|nr:lactonase family protein [Rubellimicrobium sp.]